VNLTRRSRSSSLKTTATGIQQLIKKVFMLSSPSARRNSISGMKCFFVAGASARKDMTAPTSLLQQQVPDVWIRAAVKPDGFEY
jgi:signal-transduction protein with cAMP-binding, CBS, and nucleotidyltransferase domain